MKLKSIVATALTVYGIETFKGERVASVFFFLLQQLLPFTVLKPSTTERIIIINISVATALTVYGIETSEFHEPS